MRDVVKELARHNRHEEESTGVSKGSLASIGREEEQLVFLARACDALSVTLCPHLVGKELFHNLRSAGENARGLSEHKERVEGRNEGILMLGKPSENA